MGDSDRLRLQIMAASGPSAEPEEDLRGEIISGARQYLKRAAADLQALGFSNTEILIVLTTVLVEEALSAYTQRYKWKIQAKKNGLEMEYLTGKVTLRLQRLKRPVEEEKSWRKEN